MSPLPEKVQVLSTYPKPKTVSELRSFLAVLNFYHRFLSGAADIQSCLHELVSNRKRKDNTPINLTHTTLMAIMISSEAIAKFGALGYPAMNVPLVLHVDVSATSLGDTLAQIVDGVNEPFGLFSKTQTPAQTEYSTFDGELLAAYAATKHFQNMLDGREILIYTDYKPLIYAFNQKLHKVSARQVGHLEYISHTTNIQYVPGSENVVANSLSRWHVISLSSEINYSQIATNQISDHDLEDGLQGAATGLSLKCVPFSDSQQYFWGNSRFG